MARTRDQLIKGSSELSLDQPHVDLKGAESPAGYPCKPSKTVTVDDFVFSTSTKGTPNAFNFSIIPTFVDQFPALNGLGISTASVEIEKGGELPLHTHPDATEVVILEKGSITAGFISSTDNKVYVKTLTTKGNIIVLPKGLLHFIINNGKEKAALTLIFTSVRPSVQILDLALFGNNFDSSVISKTTFLDPEQVKKLKDFCIADLKGAESPAGYPCKPSKTVTVDDFVFSTSTKGTPNAFNFSITPTFVDQFPALNGLGISTASVEIEKGGELPLHTHPDATEVVILEKGSITAGFISSTDNKVYVKTLTTKGNIIVLPKGLLHFIINKGKGKATLTLIFTRVRPSVQILDLALFGNNFDSNVISKTTFLDPKQVKKLKDFCIADLKGAESPAGYPCKPSKIVTVDDFVFSTSAKGTPNAFNFSITPAFVDQFPALNGLGISIASVEIEKGGELPLHTHPDATEVVILENGNVTAGFISSITSTTDNKVYVKTLTTKENIIVLPKGLLHFIINNGKEKAALTLIFTSVRPSVQILDLALFGNNFDSSVISKTTFLDPQQIKKLKDFCIADLKGAESPAGYPCKPSKTLTVDDFVFSTSTKGTPNAFNFSITPTFVDQFPALNGLGISTASVEIEKGGELPLHTHPDATEVVILEKGSITAGFISSTDNKVYVKTLTTKGNIIVLPKGLLHFIINKGKGKATLTLIFTSVRPSVQILDLALFGNNFDSNVISKTTFLDPKQVKKLKGIFKGSG
ncbi:hypothetical protein RIF29_28071 [Crotalaria pallida]|uniref:Cupin type-1 domain-containing protein n=1 Tax=Crotalaria pallida TaxID=3830 RepID=A0AAN9EQ94_CROPI